MFVDTHCHLNMVAKREHDVMLNKEQLKSISTVLEQAEREGVQKIINVGTSVPESLNSIEIAKRFAPVYATIGVHPCDSNILTHDDLKDVIAQWRMLLSDKEQNKIVALGETGLDFYHKPFEKGRQIDFFKAQIELALEFNLPLVVHVREAADETLTVLDEYRKNGVRGVIHCFLQQQDFADTVLDWGFYVGLDAPITYPKNDWMRTVFKNIPLERIVLETDSPFLPPQHLRGKQNLPSNIPIIAQALADLKEIGMEVVERVTTENAYALFGLNPDADY